MAAVTVRSDERYQTQIVAGRHELIADEPVGVGDDAGPSPYELLLAALGACTSMTLLMYARRKQWPLDGVTVELEHDRVYADDCEGCEDPATFIDRIDRRIRLHGPLDEEQRERLAYIATRCPVHKTLSGTPRIVDAVEVVQE